MYLILEKIKKYWILFTILILLAITFLSLWPLSKLPSVPGSDKTHHIIAYAFLAFPVALKRPKKWISIIFFFIFYSGLIELVQPYVNRYGEWLDLLANTIGLLSGLLLAIFLHLIFNITNTQRLNH